MIGAWRTQLADLSVRVGGSVAFDVSLAALTTLRVGGPAEAVFRPDTRDGLAAAVAWARSVGCPLHVLGAGSNLIAPDAGVAGLVVHTARHPAEFGFSDDELTADAGCLMPRLAQVAAQRGLAGLHTLAGVPGTLGGGCVTNAGIPAGCLGDVLTSVEALDPSGRPVTLDRDDLDLGHRTSRFRTEPGWTVLAVRCVLQPADPRALAEEIAQHLAYRRRTQPLSLPSCGSVFRRTAGADPPGALIERAGCKGWRCGGAVVSLLHANWIVNEGSATSSDVRELMGRVQAQVRATSGVVLEPEVLIWD